MKVVVKMVAETGNLRDGLRGVESDLNRTQGVYRDSLGKLRDAQGKFVAETNRASSAMERQASTSDKLVGRLGTLAGAYGALQVAASAVNLAEMYNGASDSLKIAIDGALNLEDVQNSVFAAAQRSGGALAASTNLAGVFFDVFGANGIKVEESFARSARLVETVNKGLALGGKGAAANSAALAQLIQGLQSANFAGDELKSVLENSPALAKAIAQGLGVSVGELRKLGEEGKISSVKLIGALEAAADSIDAKYSQLGASASRGFQEGLNSIQFAVADVYRDSGADQALEDFLSGGGEAIANFINESRAMFGEFREAFANTFDQALWDDLTAGGNEFFFGFGEGIKNFGSGVRDVATVTVTAFDLAFQSFATYAGIAFGRILQGLVELEGFFEDAWQNIQGYIGTALDEALKSVADFQAEVADIYALFGQDKIADLLRSQSAALAQSATFGAQGSQTQADAERAETLAKLAAREAELTAELDKRIARAAEEVSAAIDGTNRQIREVERLQNARVAADAVTTRSALAATATASKAQQKALNDATKFLQQAMKRDDDARQKSNEANLRAAERNIALDQRREEFSRRTLQNLNLQVRLLNATSDEERKRIQSAEKINVLAEQYKNLLIEIAKSRGLKTEQEIDNYIANSYQAFLARLKADQERLDKAEQDRAFRDAQSRGTFGAAEQSDGSFRQIDDLSELISTAIEEGFDAADISAFFARLKEGFGQLYKKNGGGVKGTLAVGATILDQLSGLADIARGSDGNKAGNVARSLVQAWASTGNIYAMIAVAVDKLAGGKLFGTSFERKSQGYSIGLGASGVSGQAFSTDTRQGAFFSGTRTRNTTSALDEQITKQFKEAFDSIVVNVSNAAIRLRESMITAISGTFREVTDKDGKIIEQYGMVLGRRINGDAQAFTNALFGENLVAQVATSAAVAQQIADRWRGTTAASAAALAEGAQLLFEAQANIVSGDALLDGDNALTRIVDLIESLDRPGEAAVDTYKRVALASALLEDAVDLMGVALQAGTEDFVRFAAEFSDAAGGNEQAQGLFDRFFDEFYSASERAQQRIDYAISRRNELAEGLGVNVLNVDRSAVRAQIENAINGGVTGEALVRWLQLADAIADLDEANAEYAESINMVDEALSDARQAYADFAAELSDAVDVEARQRGLSEYNNAIDAIARATQAQIEEANRLAVAAGLAGASTSDLADITIAGSLRMADAAAALEARLLTTAANLFKEIEKPAVAGATIIVGGPPPRDLRQEAADAAMFAAFNAFAGDVRSLADARGENGLSVLDRLFAPLDQLLKGLGVDMSRVFTASGFNTLLNAARQLGLEIPEIADRLSISFGELYETNSVLNNAFEDLLIKLPAAQRNELTALLRTLEGATEGADRNAAQAAIEAFINGLPTALRERFAPLLDGVDVSSYEADSLDLSRDLNLAVNAGNRILADILRAVSGPPVIAKGGVAGVSEQTASAQIEANTRMVASTLQLSDRRLVAIEQTLGDMLDEQQTTSTYLRQVLDR